MQKILITLPLLATLILAGCAHKIEIQQGNVVTLEQLAKLEPGLNRRQVRTLLGTPLLIDPLRGRIACQSRTIVSMVSDCHSIVKAIFILVKVNYRGRYG